MDEIPRLRRACDVSRRSAYNIVHLAKVLYPLNEDRFAIFGFREHGKLWQALGCDDAQSLKIHRHELRIFCNIVL